MSRTVPNRTSEQQKEHERRTALLALDVPVMRAWLERYGMGAFGDDALVLRAMHETRAVDLKLPRKVRQESIAWLKATYPDSTTLQVIAAYPKEFR